MATFSKEYHLRRGEVTVSFQCYRLGKLPASRLVTAALHMIVKCRVIEGRYHETGYG